VKVLGHHIIAELSNCNRKILADVEILRNIMIRAAQEANTQIKQDVFHKFSPHGISGVIVIAESHLAIHTWPEYGYAAIDIYTCGDVAVPRKACDYISENLEAESITYTVIERGIKSNTGDFRHIIYSSFNEGRQKVISGA